MKIQTEITKTEQKTAIAIGYFDGVHLGHAEVIRSAVQAAKRLGAVPCVFTFDMSFLRPDGKAGGDIVPERDKRNKIENLGVELYISPVFADISGLSGTQFVEQVLSKTLGAACLCCGHDFRFGKDRENGTKELCKICEKLGIELILADDVMYDGLPISSTRIKKALAAGDMRAAADMLGRNYSLCLPVCGGKKMARKLGFPTINQQFPPNLAQPRRGVYYTKINVDGKYHDSISNIGLRPTVDAGAETVSLETHILGFSNDLYGRDITVEFLEFIRDERKFESIAELKDAVDRDIAAVTGIISPR